MLVKIFIIIVCRNFCCKQLCLRSEHEKVETELVMAKGKIEHLNEVIGKLEELRLISKGKIEELEKEMNLMKETQAGFRSDNSNSRLPN